jgi:hypothetical protein
MNPKIAVLSSFVLLFSCLGEKKTTDAQNDMTSQDTILLDIQLDNPETTGEKIYENSCSEEKKCKEGFTCIEKICLLTPKEESHITDYPEETPTNQSPNLDCVENPFEKPAGPEKVRLEGIVDRFGQGRLTFPIRISLMKLEDFHPEICEQISDETKRSECFYNYGNPEICASEKDENKKADCMKTVGNPFAWAVSEDPDKTKDDFDSDCQKHLDCGHGFECDSKYGKCQKQYGKYKIDDVPTNTPIIIKSQAVEFIDKWKNTFTWFVYLFADNAVKCENEGCEYEYRLNATIVSDGQWESVPNTMMIGNIKKGNSAIGGRVQDCRIAGQRVSWPMSNVTVMTGNPPVIVGYFTESEDDALPDPNRMSTNIFGTYAALDIVPGFNRIAGAVLAGSGVKSAGSVDLYIIPDALMIVNFPGRLSYIRK